jgi:hypothetical protein
MAKTRQWQVEASFPNGAITTFGVRGRKAPTALLKAYQRLAEYPVVADQVTLHRVHWRGKRWSARNEDRRAAAYERAALPSDARVPSAQLPPSLA